MSGVTNRADTEDAARFSLATYLGPECFPARSEGLIASLLRGRAPSRLLAHVAGAPEAAEFVSLADLQETLGRLPERPTEREDR